MVVIFCLGLQLAALCPSLSPYGALNAAIAALAAALLLQFLRPEKKWAGFCTLLLLALTTGLFLGLTAREELAAFTPQAGEELQIAGKVMGNPLRCGDDPISGQPRYRLQLQLLTVNGRPYRGAGVYLYSPAGGDIPAGSIISLSATMAAIPPPAAPHAFDYGDYLARQGVAAILYAKQPTDLELVQAGSPFSLWALGRLLLNRFDQACALLPTTQADLVKGVFLGDKNGLDYQLNQALSLSGALHAFSVSGLHIGFIVALSCLLAGGGYHRRWLRLLLSLIFITLYISLTGPLPSVLRAAVMAICLLMGQALGEKNDNLTALALAALINLTYKPLWLGDVGFQLSFMAVLGIILLLPPLEKLLQRLPAPIGKLCGVTFAASLGIIPFISYYFYHITWLGWLLSPLVTLASGVTVLLSFAACLLALLSPALAGWLLLGAGDLMTFTAATASWLCRLPGAFSLTGALPLPWLLGFYLLLPLFPPLVRRGKNIAAALFLLLLTLTFSLLPGVLPTQKMTALQNLDQDALAEIVFLDVGQGDCTLVLLPQGTVLLIDGGGKEGSPGSVGENILLPYLKSRAIDHIDIIINSHPHGDHLDGLLSVLEQLPVDTLITAAAAARNSQQLLLLDTAARQGVHILPLSAGDIYPVEQARLQVYWPEKEGDYDQDPNAGSLIFELCYGEIDLLFPGDAEAPQLQQATAAYDVEAEIIKMPH
ncbi:MAG: ComEC/Rec2 family competence protein, partial [Clostridiales bacterium]